MGKYEKTQLLPLGTSENWVQQETWFEVMRCNKPAVSEPYILIINSYGRLRRLYTDTGKYKDISNGGSV